MTADFYSFVKIFSILYLFIFMFADMKKVFEKKTYKKKFKMSFVERKVTTTLKCKKTDFYSNFFFLMRNKIYLRRIWTKSFIFFFVSRKRELRMLHWTEFFDKIIKIISIYWVLKLFKSLIFFFIIWLWNEFVGSMLQFGQILAVLIKFCI